MPSAKCLGGSTTHSNAIHVRGNKKDYDDWSMMGAEGWSYEEVLPYFKKLEDNKEYRDGKLYNKTNLFLCRFVTSKENVKQF